MCIIIDNREGHIISKDIADNCVRINPDGFGRINLESNRVERTMKPHVAKQWITDGVKSFIHCRYATVGQTTKKNCHPFQFSGGYLMQNGTVSGIKTGNRTDASHIASMLEYIDRDNHDKFLSSFDSRFVVVYNDGGILTTGKWYNKNGVGYSKDNVFGQPAPCKRLSYSVQEVPLWDEHRYDFGYDGFVDIDTHLVAVYGTLKQGHGNHHLLEGEDFIGDVFTTDKYRLCVDGLPYLINGPERDKGEHVEMELYEVSDITLESLDRLEGHPGFYKREQIGVCDSFDFREYNAWVYMVGEQYDTGKYTRSF